MNKGILKSLVAPLLRMIDEKTIIEVEKNINLKLNSIIESIELQELESGIYPILASYKDSIYLMFCPTKFENSEMIITRQAEFKAFDNKPVKFLKISDLITELMKNI